MGRYLIFFSYIGTRYRGLQKQVTNGHVLDVDSVQGAIESSLLTLRPKLVNPPIFSPSSRTDAGVHALMNAAHVDLENVENLFYHPETLIKCINRHLQRCKHEIKVLRCVPVTDKFNARFAAKSRTYLYRILVPKCSRERGFPISELNRSTLITYDKFDIEKAKKATQLFVGLRDFQTFAAANKTNKAILYRRILHELTVEEGSPLLKQDFRCSNFDYWDIKFRGKSFVHNQVRRIVGALCALAADRVTEKDVITMLQVPSHKNWDTRITPVAAHGLYLTNIEYDPREIKDKTIPYNEDEFIEANLPYNKKNERIQL